MFSKIFFGWILHIFQALGKASIKILMLENAFKEEEILKVRVWRRTKENEFGEEDRRNIEWGHVGHRKQFKFYSKSNENQSFDQSWYLVYGSLEDYSGYSIGYRLY
jgi:hypothetical protein